MAFNVSSVLLLDKLKVRSEMKIAKGIPCLICILSYLITYSHGGTYYVPEEEPVNTLIGNIAVQERIKNLVNESEFKNLAYYFSTVLSYFSLNSSTSDLRNVQLLDRETICKFSKEFNCPVILDVFVHSEVGKFFKKLSITIEIEDINDNAPKFASEVVSITILESEVIGTTYPLDSANDADSANFSMQSYQLFPTNVPFGVDFQTHADGSFSLNLIVIGKLDREVTDHYLFCLIAKDSGNPPLNGSEVINITVADVNDNKPLFESSSYSVTVNETFPLNTTFLTVVATDADIGVNTLITYRLSAQQMQAVKDTFQINSTTGNLYLIKNLVFTSDIPIDVKVEATDSGIHPLSSQVTVQVTVKNSKNHSPKIILNLLTDLGYASISECASFGTPVTYVKAIDVDEGHNGLVSCDIQNDYFILQLLGSNEYKVEVNAQLDREKIAIYVITIICSDSGVPPLNVSTNFTVVVLDKNDNMPIFSQALYTVVVQENNIDGITVIQVYAKDADSGENGNVSYSLIPNENITSHFSINANTGLVTAVGSFDRETKSSYQFTVLAVDAGKPPLSSTASVYIKIGDQNDNAPNFTSSVYQFYILENQSKETILGKVSATDPDENDPDENSNGFVFYSVYGNYTNLPFQVLPDGTIKSLAELDQEQISTYQFQVIAKDNGVVQLSSTANITIHVTDVNDNFPEILFPQEADFVKYITYMTAPETQIMKIDAKDNDEGINAELSFSIQSQNDLDMFKINFNGEIYTTRKMYDKDISHYLLLINVSDNGSPPKTTFINVTIAIVTKNITDLVTAETSIEKQNIFIAVIVVIVTVLMAVAILIIIWVVRRNDLRKKKAIENGASSNHNRPPHNSGFSSNHGWCTPNAVKMIDGSTFPKMVYLSTAPAINSSCMEKIDNKQKVDATFQFSAEVTRELKKHEDFHSDLSVDTGTYDSGVGGSVSDTGDLRIFQLQQLVQQSGRRGNLLNKTRNGQTKSPYVIARGCSEIAEKPSERPPSLNYNHYKAKSSIQSHLNISPTGSPTDFITSSPIPCSLNQSPCLPSPPPIKQIPNRCSPTKSVLQDLFVYKQFHHGLRHNDIRREVSVDTTHIDDDDDDGSTTSGSYYIENPLDDMQHPPVSDIYV